MLLPIVADEEGVERFGRRVLPVLCGDAAEQGECREEEGKFLQHSKVVKCGRGRNFLGEGRGVGEAGVGGCEREGSSVSEGRSMRKRGEVDQRLGARNMCTILVCSASLK